MPFETVEGEENSLRKTPISPGTGGTGEEKRISAHRLMGLQGREIELIY